MTREKVKLRYITHDPTRKQTFKKRKKGIMKKAEELSILCGIEACVIIYSEYDSQPAVWPSHLGVQRVLSQFNTMTEMEQSKKMVNQEDFLRQRTEKANGQLMKKRRNNRETEMTRVMFESLTGKPFQGLSMVDLNDLRCQIDQNLEEIHSRKRTLKEEAQNKNQVHVPPSPADHGVLRSGKNSQQAADGRPPWFMDLGNPEE